MSELAKDIWYAVFLGIGLIAFVLTVTTFLMSSIMFFPSVVVMIVCIAMCKTIDQ